jgi:ribosome-associated protein
MIPIAPDLSIDERDIELSYIRSTGPGGQNVNKVSSAAQLRFDVRRAKSLPPWLLTRLRSIAGSRLTKQGEIVITANRFRTQDANRKDAMRRLVELLEEAAHPPKHRVPTRPGRAEKARRLEAKARRSFLKRQRNAPLRSEI